MATFRELADLAGTYNYDINHNLRYIALAKLVVDCGIKDALILGCGKGILEYVIPENVRCTSIDINQRDIDIAKNINAGKPNRSFIVGDIIEWLKKVDMKYQAVIISEVLEHLTEDERVITAVRKVIEPGSLFLLTVPNIDRLDNKIQPLIGRRAKYMSDEHLREYCQDEICGLLSKSGFRTRKVDYVYLRFPKEDQIRKVIPVDSRLRDLILRIKPNWGAYIIIVSSPL